MHVNLIYLKNSSTSDGFIRDFPINLNNLQYVLVKFATWDNMK